MSYLQMQDFGNSICITEVVEVIGVLVDENPEAFDLVFCEDEACIFNLAAFGLTPVMVNLMVVYDSIETVIVMAEDDGQLIVGVLEDVGSITMCESADQHGEAPDDPASDCDIIENPADDVGNCLRPV